MLKNQPQLSNDNYIVKEFEKYDKSELSEATKIYIYERLISQIIWYDDKSIVKQNKYKILTIISIIATSVIPILTLLTTYKYGLVANIIISILSGISAVVLAISNLCQYQKLWIEYRSNCEILKSTLHRFFNHVGEFKSLEYDEAVENLIFVSEEYLTKEYKTWTEAYKNLNSEC